MICFSLPLVVTSTGKTLMSLQNKAQEAAQSSTTQVGQSCYGSTHLSMVEETCVDVGAVRVGTLEEIPVSQCLVRLTVIFCLWSGKITG